MLIKPRRLEPGMTIGLIAPASGATNPEVIDAGVVGLNAAGFKIKEGRSMRSRVGYLAASDAARTADVHAMFEDRRVNAIMCMRGGYGTPRLLPFLDWKIIRRNPKIFIGFSDITMLHLGWLRHCNLVSFNGPMLTFTWADESPSRYTVAGFERTLMRPEAAGSIWQGHADRTFRVIRHGHASGPLTGGNLSLVAASIGSSCEIETRGKIVFLEEVDEKPYRMDRMLTQLLNAGKLSDAKAIVFGRNVPDDDTAKLEEQRQKMGLAKLVAPTPKAVPRDYEPDTDEMIANCLRHLKIPILTGLPFGHVKDHATLPIGIRATVNSKTGDLTIDEPAVV